MNRKSKSIGKSGPMPAKESVTVRQIDYTKTVQLHCKSLTEKSFSVWVKKEHLTKAIERYTAKGYTVHLQKP